MFRFFTPRKQQKTSGFPLFPRCKKGNIGLKWIYNLKNETENIRINVHAIWYICPKYNFDRRKE